MMLCLIPSYLVYDKYKVCTKQNGANDTATNLTLQQTSVLVVK